VRPGEAAALRWRHYDPAIKPLGKLLVARSYNTRKNREKSTKTDAVKHVPVHPVLAAMLAEWKLDGWAEMVGTRRRRITVVARRQRGGIDSDPLVRLLAFRAWGDRDRYWFEDRGVRRGDAVDHIDGFTVVAHAAVPVIARTWNILASCGQALEDGRPGEVVTARIDMSRLSGMPGMAVGTWRTAANGGDPAELDVFPTMVRGIVDIRCRVCDRLRTR
jgi:hypothetical protein